MEQKKHTTAAVTSRDVANYAKVSQPTVSRVFNNPENVRPETVEKVKEAAALLGYTPNAIARSLNRKQTDLVAVVTVNFKNPFYQKILMQISDMLNRLGKQMLFIQSEFEQSLDSILESVLQYRVDGIIVLSAAISSEMRQRFTKIDLPLVIFNKQFDSRFFYSVCSDNVDTGRMVAEYFLDRGYTSFGYISGDMLKQTSGNRFKGYRDMLEQNGYSCMAVENGDYMYQSGHEALLRMQEKGLLPRAVFCANDLMAFGAMDAARNTLHLRVPEDIAFVGVDNLYVGEWESYALTSVAQPVEDMIEYTYNYLKKRFEGHSASGGYVLLKCRLVERSSS